MKNVFVLLLYGTKITMWGYIDCTFSVMTGKLTAVQRSNSLCDPEIIVSGLGIMFMWICMFLNSTTTQEKIPVWSNVKKNIRLFL